MVGVPQSSSVAPAPNKFSREEHELANRGEATSAAASPTDHRQPPPLPQHQRPTKSPGQWQNGSAVVAASSSATLDDGRREKAAIAAPSSASDGEGRRKRKNQCLKYTSFILMVLQTTLMVLFIRYQSVQSAQQTKPFLKSVMVFVTTVATFLLSLVLFVAMNRPLKKSTAEFRGQTWWDIGRMFIPAFAYTGRGILLYVSVANLDAATYAITYELKVFTAAVLTVCWLKRRISPLQWLALFILIAGVAAVEFSSHQSSKNSTANATLLATNATTKDDLHHEHSPSGPLIFASTTPSLSPLENTTLSPNMASSSSAQQLQAPSSKTHVESWLTGFLSGFVASVLSGFSGVYFEKVLKNGSKASIWLRTAQLNLVMLGFSGAAVAIMDGKAVLQDGLLQGFDELAWVVIFLQAVGNLLVTMVVNYTDNLWKAFANALSIVLISIISALFLTKAIPNIVFLIGAALVIGAIVLYAFCPAKQQKIEEKA